MKIVLTGSLGNISRPLSKILTAKGHEITVISSKPERAKEIKALNATAAIGNINDANFLTKTFKGADIVYLMEPFGAHNFRDEELDYKKSISDMAYQYRSAVQQSGVKRVVHLSSIGAHVAEGNGLLAFHHLVENILAELPTDVSIKFMRPVGFYYNMFAYIPTIKSQNAIIQNYGGDEKEPWVSPLDIAETIAEEMEKPFAGREIRYIASDEVSPNEVAKILGKAIGKPGLQWQQVSNEEMLEGMERAGFNPQIAKDLVEMNASRFGGALYDDYYLNRPVPGKIKLEDFAKEFATAYHKN